MIKIYIIFTLLAIITELLSMRNIKKLHEIFKEKGYEVGTFKFFSIIEFIRCFIPIYHIRIGIMNIAVIFLNYESLEYIVNNMEKEEKFK